MCAHAIKEHFEENGVYCEITDALAFVSQCFSSFISNGHSFLYRCLPSLFRIGYSHYQNNSNSYSEKSMLFKILSKGAKNLGEYIEKGKFDTVICTHVFAGMMLSKVDKTECTPFVSAFVATDYTCYAMSVKCNSDIYFIPDFSLSETYEEYGIPGCKLIISGIPIRKSFYNKIDAERAKAELGIKNGEKHVLVMSGSIGCGPIKKITKQIAAELKNVKFTVICGNNSRMYKRMSRVFLNCGNVNIVGYCENVSLYMDSADVYITKAGGISTTEAMVKQLPMLIVDSVGGCEEYNIRYFEKSGGAVISKRTADVTELCRKLIDSEKIRLDMSKELYRLLQENPVATIFTSMQKIWAEQNDALHY